MDRVAELLDGWRTLATWRRDWTLSPGPRTVNRLVDRLNATAELAVADPADVARLREIAEKDPDPFVRQDARYWVTPWVPRPTDPPGSLERWLRHPLVADLVDADVRAEDAIVLQPNPGLETGTARQTEFDPEVDRLTWFGGWPLGGDGAGWPCAPDGTPLVHVAQLELADQAQTEAWALLPREGVLQFFHDGFFHDGRGHGLVRHLRKPGRAGLEPPGGVTPRVEVEPIDIWTFPAKFPAARQRMLETVFSEWGLLEEYGPVQPLPTLLGVDRRGDRRRLLHLPGEPAVDFWIRDDDLRDHDFSAVTCTLEDAGEGAA